jgi:hypothetical protein
MVRGRFVIFLQFVVYVLSSMASLCGKRIHANIGNSSHDMKHFLSILRHLAAHLRWARHNPPEWTRSNEVPVSLWDSAGVTVLTTVEINLALTKLALCLAPRAAATSFLVLITLRLAMAWT